MKLTLLIFLMGISLTVYGQSNKKFSDYYYHKKAHFENLPNADDEIPYVAPVAYLESKSQDPEMETESADWTNHNNTLLYAGLDELDERSQDIIRSRWLQDGKMTLQELANRYGISAERVRQLEANALRKMRASITA